MSKRKRQPTQQKRRPWQPLQRSTPSDPELYERHGMSAPDRSYANDLYSVFVREIPDANTGRPSGALHLSFHRHDRAAVRDWRHFQAIKNEIAGRERTAIEIFPPESQLIDAANEYHLWVLPEGFPLPFVIPARNVKTHAEGVAELGKTKARQRDWQPGIPTGRGLDTSS